jgi:hypothetical protein
MAGSYPFDPDSYAEWDATHNEVDSRLIELIVGNERQYGQPFNPSSHGQVPDAYLTLGYEAAANLMTEALGSSVENTSVRHYWGIDRERTYSSRMPIPDAVIAYGKAGELLPGWTRQTILNWLPTREGSGNHTRGEGRRGYNGGRTGMTKVGGVWISSRSAMPV